MTPRIAIIGGSGLNTLPGFELIEQRALDTRWGKPSAALAIGRLGDTPVAFLPRHGAGHTLPPHAINYRANIAALADAGIEQVVACCAVGGITSAMGPRVLALPDQLIDYSWGRAHSFSDGAGEPVNHVDFTHPFTPALRTALHAAATAAGVSVVDGGCYGNTQGPRLETAAEIARMERDGCDLVGMTGMPEAGLAREAGLAYAQLALVANWAAGKSDEELTIEEIEAHLAATVPQAMAVLAAWVHAAG